MKTASVQFGHSEMQKLPPTFGFNEKGGMDNTEFSRYLLDLTSRIYPDRADEPGRRVLVKLDSGPGRNSEDLKALLRTEGVYLHMGVPNGTAVGQETDQQSNYGTFKPCLRRNRNRLFSYRQSRYHVELALLEKNAAAAEIESDNDDADGNHDNDNDENEVIEINSDDDDDDTEEGTRPPDLCLVYPFAADRERIECAAQGLVEAIAEAPLSRAQDDVTPTQNRAFFVSICSHDIERLKPQTWLNDTLVDFWMMW
jgi:hypothetical protein